MLASSFFSPKSEKIYTNHVAKSEKIYTNHVAKSEKTYTNDVAKSSHGREEVFIMSKIN